MFRLYKTFLPPKLSCIPYSGEILTGENVDRHRLFKYLTENILTDGHCLLLNAVLPSNFKGLNFDGLAGKHQNFPLHDYGTC